jgi:hypothetical protein
MGRRPVDKDSIDRIDNEGNYCKENCRWATKLEQNNNKRNNKCITFLGSTKTITNWCKDLQISRSTYYRNIKAGLSPEFILDKYSYNSDTNEYNRGLTLEEVCISHNESLVHQFNNPRTISIPKRADESRYKLDPAIECVCGFLLEWYWQIEPNTTDENHFCYKCGTTIESFGRCSGGIEG